MLSFRGFKQAEQKVAVKDKACLCCMKIICKSQNALNQTDYHEIATVFYHKSLK